MLHASSGEKKVPQAQVLAARLDKLSLKAASQLVERHSVFARQPRPLASMISPAFAKLGSPSGHPPL
eukprot:scaffold22018_cov60-Phaeocystis_antarctica.AAC.1